MANVISTTIHRDKKAPHRHFLHVPATPDGGSTPTPSTTPENIRQPHAEGIAEANARGVRFGILPNQLPEDFDMLVRLWKDKELTTTEAAQLCGMACPSFRYRAAKI